MSYDDDWPDQTLENRRKELRETIRRATVAELKQLGEQHFTVVTDPWCERYNSFLKQNPDAKFYLASIPGGAQVVYCGDTRQGLWLRPGEGMGVIQPKGLQVLADIVDAL